MNATQVTLPDGSTETLRTSRAVTHVVVARDGREGKGNRWTIFGKGSGSERAARAKAASSYYPWMTERRVVAL